MKTKSTFIIVLTTLLICTLTYKTRAQIVYVDIDPDTTIYVPDVAWNIDSSQYYDFNIEINTVIFPFRFRARNYYFYSMGPQWGTSLNIYSYNSQGNYNFYANIAGGCAVGGFREDIIYLDNINNLLNWDVTKYLRFNVQNVNFTCDIPIGDAYFGLMQINNTDTLYGWVRCTATDNSITIKDYAYNTIPNMYILAGQTTTGTATMPPDNISIYENNGMLIMTFSERYLSHGHIRIFNYLGSLVKTGHIKGNYNSISLAGLTSGVYIIQVETKDKVFNKRMYIQAF